MTGERASFRSRGIEFLAQLVVVGLLVNWAWCLLSPFIPIAVVVVGLALVGTWLVRRRGGW